MENKYYKPTIEEFHIGFEYEYFQDLTWEFGNNFAQDFCDHDSDSVYELKNNLSKNLVRCKFLDKEDIESLGFEQQSLPYQFKKDWYRLIKRHGENQYIIEDGRHQDQIFVGVIRNKSEFKKLLTMLEIN